jgi:hypothetical protein
MTLAPAPEYFTEAGNAAVVPGAPPAAIRFFRLFRNCVW